MLLDLTIILATGLMARAAYQAQRDALTAVLGWAWGLASLVTVAILAGILRHSYVPGALAVIDIMIALVALVVWTNERDRRAQAVGMISITLLCAHFGFSASRGGGGWTIYAFILNAGFMAQCITAGGGWYGVAHFIDRFRGRNRRLHMHRDGSR